MEWHFIRYKFSGKLYLVKVSEYIGYFFYLFDLILYIPSTIFQLCRDGSSWVEPALS